jgi:hypothetical protein
MTKKRGEKRITALGTNLGCANKKPTEFHLIASFNNIDGALHRRLWKLELFLLCLVTFILFNHHSIALTFINYISIKLFTVRLLVHPSTSLLILSLSLSLSLSSCIYLTISPRIPWLADSYTGAII